MDPIFFDNWQSVVRTVAIGVMAYISLIVFLRISGKRTLVKMNAFDFVITVSLGSVLATILLNREVTLAQGASAFAILVLMQFLVTWSSVRWSWIRKVVTGEPTLLFYQNKFLPTALLRTRMTEDEVRAAVRATGVESFAEIKAVVLETDGSISVVKHSSEEGLSSLKGVEHP